MPKNSHLLDSLTVEKLEMLRLRALRKAIQARQYVTDIDEAICRKINETEQASAKGE